MKERLAGLAHIVIRLAAEAGWLTVVYAAAAVTLDRRPPALGPIEFAGLVGVGVLVGRYARLRPGLGAVMLMAAAFGAGALGALATEDARAALSTDALGALGLHASGWLGALAVLRGAVIRIGPSAERQAESLLRRALPAAVLLWAMGTIAAPDALRLPLTISAMWGTVVLITTALWALGLARLATLHDALPNGPARRRWQWLVVGVGLAVAPLALPFALLSGIPIGALFGPIVRPLQAVIPVLAYPFGLLAEWLIGLFRPLLGPFVGQLLDFIAERLERRPPAAEGEPPILITLLGIALALIATIVLIAIVLVLVHWLLERRQRGSLDESPLPFGDEHVIDVPAARSHRPGSAARRAARRPAHDAVTAYLGALVELERHPPYARQPTETPAQHSARTKSAGMPRSAELARLAAGYQLARYGGRVLTRSEDRRAVGRFERIRRSLRVMLRR